MMDHSMYFKGVIWKIIPKLSLLPLPMWSTEKSKETKQKKKTKKKVLTVTILKNVTP